MRILVTGGRDFADKEQLFSVLDKLNESQQITQVIHGAARGADLIADEWAKNRGINYLGCPADWKRYGKRAGFIRNREMLQYKPDLIVAFPGGNGTKDMVNVAKLAGFKVMEVDYENQTAEKEAEDSGNQIDKKEKI